MANEGRTLLVLDDVKEICKQLGLRDLVESILNLGRSAGICAVLSTTETAYVAGRSQGAMIWVGYTGGGLAAARVARSCSAGEGAARQDECARTGRHEWIYQDHENGEAGPVLVTARQP